VRSPKLDPVLPICFRTCRVLKAPTLGASEIVDFAGITVVGGRGIEPLTPSMSRKVPNLYNQLLIYLCAPFVRIGVGSRSARLASLDTLVCK
jgi:hypothetical protein